MKKRKLWKRRYYQECEATAQFREMLVETIPHVIPCGMEDHHAIANISHKLNCSPGVATRLLQAAMERFPGLGIVQTRATIPPF